MRLENKDFWYFYLIFPRIILALTKICLKCFFSCIRSTFVFTAMGNVSIHFKVGCFKETYERPIVLLYTLHISTLVH